jgi:hypothetical protein
MVQVTTTMVDTTGIVPCGDRFATAFKQWWLLTVLLIWHSFHNGGMGESLFDGLFD